MNPPEPDCEYVLGVNDVEVERLRGQHAIWRADAASAWQTAGFRPRQTILDVGCGPGFATVDLAEIVGRDGRIVAIDQSRRFLDYLGAQIGERGLDNVNCIEGDVSTYAFDGLRADGAWLRWILAFVSNPRAVLDRVVDALAPGGHIAIHEYVAYENWKLVPGSPVFEGFVATIMASWRARGGEPNVGLELPGWLETMGMEIRATRVISDIVTRANPRWHWPVAFAHSGLDRLVELGDMSESEGVRVRSALDALGTDESWMLTPSVVEIVARKRQR